VTNKGFLPFNRLGPIVLVLWFLNLGGGPAVARGNYGACRRLRPMPCLTGTKPLPLMWG